MRKRASLTKVAAASGQQTLLPAGQPGKRSRSAVAVSTQGSVAAEAQAAGIADAADIAEEAKAVEREEDGEVGNSAEQGKEKGEIGNVAERGEENGEVGNSAEQAEESAQDPLTGLSDCSEHEQDDLLEQMEHLFDPPDSLLNVDELKDGSTA